MRILYLTRKSSTYSIEKVFSLVENRLKDYAYINTKKAYSKYDKPFHVLINLIHFIFIYFKNRNKYDIFHITGVIHYVSILFPPSKTVLTIHDCIKYHQQKGLKKIIVKYLWFKLPVNHLKYITVISEKTKKELVEITQCSSQKIRVIYNPLDESYLYNDNNFNSFCPRILHVGTTPNKNLNNLFHSLKRTNCLLIIVGNITHDEKKTLEQLKINYRCLSNISEEEMVEQYNLCDIVSFITTYEGFGLPIIEAQSVGRVVISSRMNPHMEVGGDGAFYVDPHNIDEIENGFKNLISNPNLRKYLIEEGKKNIQNFLVDKISNKYLEFYESIIHTNN